MTAEKAVCQGNTAITWCWTRSFTCCVRDVNERIANHAVFGHTIRRRLAEWAKLGIAAKLHALYLAAFDHVIGLQLGEISADGCITKAPCGGEKAGQSPADRRKGGLKRFRLPQFVATQC